MHHGMDVHQSFVAINCIENTPFGHCVFVQSRETMNRLMAKIFDVGGDPFRFVEKALTYRQAGSGKVLNDTALKRQPIPGHLATNEARAFQPVLRPKGARLFRGKP